MKKLLCTFIAIGMVAVMNSQNVKKLDEKYGFRQTKFEMHKDSLSNLKEVEASGETKYYTKLDENLSIGEFSVSEIVYGFYKNKLSSIHIKVKGYSNSRGILAVLQELYGAGYQENRYLEKYAWYGAKASCAYQENSATHDSSVLLWSKPMYLLEKEEKAAAAKKAAEGF